MAAGSERGNGPQESELLSARSGSELAAEVAKSGRGLCVEELMGEGLLQDSGLEQEIRECPPEQTKPKEEEATPAEMEV